MFSGDILEKDWLKNVEKELVFIEWNSLPAAQCKMSFKA